ncbi:MAG: DUF1122 family protein [Pyrobaculum sp.]
MLSRLTEDSFKPLRAVSRRGRFAEETNFELYDDEGLLLVVKVFKGRPPHYGPWAEAFSISPRAHEKWLREVLCVLYRYMEPGDVLYVEYVDDPDTFVKLQRGDPPEETRIGKLLVECGFKIVKNWYHPEGGLEGGMKLQATK